MSWSPKPSNWRRYWGYRPPSLAMPPMGKKSLKRVADAYTTWLAESRGWTIAEATQYIAQTQQSERAPTPIARSLFDNAA